MTIYCKHILPVLLILAPAGVLAQTLRVKGLVKDSFGNPEISATIRIYQLPDTITPKTSGITDDDGEFSIPLPEEGGYRVNICSFGKKDFNKDVYVNEQFPTVNIGTVTISPIENVPDASVKKTPASINNDNVENRKN